MRLLYTTSSQWVEKVLSDFDGFLLDHAACERKASGMAMSMLAHYPDKPDLVKQMTDLAVEELQHFKMVMRFIEQRGLVMPADTKDLYVNELRKLFRREKQEYFMDRLIMASIIELRGCERFFLVAQHCADEKVKSFYDAIAKSEEKHYELFIDLANQYFDPSDVEKRANELLIVEADIVKALPLRAALH
jgi:tRNA 2-(methylsulfanyl)-N6-isopentenyladenosine37 hydroxylase